MKVIKFQRGDQLPQFLENIAKEGSRPMIYIGADANNELTLHLAAMSWGELAHVKTAFEMHVIKDWLGLLGGEK